MASPGGLTDSVRERAEFPATPLLVAVSGGADSGVLLWAAAATSNPVRAVFVDHGLAHSNELRAAAAAIAEKLAVPLDVVPAPVDPDTASFEDAARDARYRALSEAGKPGETIVTGHTSDDQAETVLGNALRGAGTRGLAGIPRRRGTIARPLLAVSRAETRELADQLGLPYHDDPANLDRAARRNRIRHELIPQLEAEFNPNLREALARTATIVAADDAALEAQSQLIPVTRDEEAVFIPAALLELSDSAVASRAVRRAIRMIRGPHRGLHDEAAAVMEVASRRRRGAEIGAGIRVDREGPWVVLHGADLAPRPTELLEVPTTKVFDRWEVDLREVAEPPRPRPIGGRIAVLSASVATAPLRLEPGRVDGTVDIGEGSKRIRDVLADGWVPRRYRDRWPVLWSGDRVAWVAGHRVAHWARPTSGEACLIGEARPVGT